MPVKKVNSRLPNKFLFWISLLAGCSKRNSLTRENLVSTSLAKSKDVMIFSLLCGFLMSNSRLANLSPSKLAFLSQQIEGQLSLVKAEPIAIIGMGCRLPGGATSPFAFWQLLEKGKEAISGIPRDRWNAESYYDPNPNTPGKMHACYGAFLSAIDQFDPQFFGISPREAEPLDPQQRLLLEVTWEALEYANQVPEQLRHQSTGVFLGICSLDYQNRMVYSRINPSYFDTYFVTGNSFSTAAGRLAYLLGLYGPAISVDTACSSSLVAVHLACQSLRLRECQVALAAGVNILLSPINSICFAKSGMMAADGRCKTFDASADGYVRGEGCGVVVLKRLADALADNDQILAIIRGSAVNQDGASGGLTVPNGLAQQALIRQALDNSGVLAEQVSYIEAHGTGTALGDPIEIGALGAVFGKKREHNLYVGSVKTNIGHLEGAAGIAGLIKVVLCLKHRQIPPHLNFKTPNPYIPWKQLPITIPTHSTPWNWPNRRLAGVSSFGFSGTNAHVILEEAPALEATLPSVTRPSQLLAISAKTATALVQLAQRYHDYLSDSEYNLEDITWSANTGRTHFRHRLCLLASTVDEVRDKLATWLAGISQVGLFTGESPLRPPKVVFVFTEENGDLWARGREFYETSPSFRKFVDEGGLGEVLHNYPAIVIQYAIAQLLMSWDIQPSVVIGEGIGELVAACVAGFIDWKTTLRLSQGEFDFPINCQASEVALISQVTGDFLTPEMANHHYWQQRKRVSIQEQVNNLKLKGYEIFLTIGTDGFPVEDESVVCLSSPPQWEILLSSVAQLYTLGLKINWVKYDQDYSHRKLTLPTYPFERQSYWRDIPKSEVMISPKIEGNRLIDWLQAGKTAQITHLLATTSDFSPEELRLLPKLLKHLEQAALTDKPIRDKDNSPDEPKGFYKLPDLYEITWLPTDLSIGDKSLGSGSWLILADNQGLGEALAAAIRQQGNFCWLVKSSEMTCEKSAFASLLEQICQSNQAPLARVIHLWSLDKDLDLVHSVNEKSLLYLLQTLTNYQEKFTPLLWVVTQGVLPIDNHHLAPIQAPIWGLGKVIALEHSSLWGGMIDVDAGCDPNILMKYLWLQGEEDQIALRGGQAYVPRLRKTPDEKILNPSFDAQGSYLITGGMGALGLQVAEWMVKQGAKHLVLLSRRGMSAQAEKVINPLINLGIDIQVKQVDVGVKESLESVINEIAASGYPLRGIMHTAGVLEDGILLGQTWESFEKVRHPKVLGTWYLHELTQDLSLEFFVCFSSLASVLGSPGQGNYAAANSFMDALVYYRRQKGLTGLSINWGPWDTTGMTAQLTVSHQQRIAQRGLTSLNTQEALICLGNAIQKNYTQVAIAHVDWEKVSQLQASFGYYPSLLKELTDNRPIISSTSGELLKSLQEMATSDRFSFLLTHLQTQVSQILGLKPAAINPEQSLLEMGLDSLMAVEFNTLIRAELNIDLPLGPLINEPTLQNLTQLLLKQLFGETELTINEDLDLTKEAVLPDDIYPVESNCHHHLPQTILLTGATGFLGAFLLAELLEQTAADIYCLVRGETEDVAKSRLQKNLETYKLWRRKYWSRIVPILGDLAEPTLGLNSEQFDKLSETIDVIYHNGALLSYVYPYSRLKPTNVLGTQAVLRLATQGKTKPFHFISSTAVFESSVYYGKTLTEFEPITESKDIYLGYSQTKWVSERLVMIAGERGLPITVHRPPLISGHSKTGLWATDDFLGRMIKGCIRLRAIPDLDLLLDIAPVDYVSQAVVYLSCQKDFLGRTFHLQNPYPLSWGKFIDFIRSLGYPIKVVTYQEWTNLLSDSQDKNNPLYPLLPFFQQKWSEDNFTYIELNSPQRKPKISCEATLAALQVSSLQCPPLDDLLAIYLGYFMRSQFLNLKFRKG